ncbi:MAG: ATP-binding cassette domain-containing protein [Gordonia sp. (in: high G+C Gram-positive bacteria)]
MNSPSTTSSPAIRVRGLEKAYGDVKVLTGVTFNVPRGRVAALLGSNGAGKTTLVRILATLLPSDAGTAEVNGFDVRSGARHVRESISLTGQFAAVDGLLTGRENLTMIAKLLRVENPASSTDRLLNRLGLTEVADRRAATYSGGTRRRLDIAMSLIGNPAVLFLDEPTTGLDPQRRLEVWKVIDDLAKAGTTVLLTTQDLGEAETLADRVYILHEGRIVTEGTVEELKRLLPPPKVEYVERQPTLEDVFFAIVGTASNGE